MKFPIVVHQRFNSGRHSRFQGQPGVVGDQEKGQNDMITEKQKAPSVTNRTAHRTEADSRVAEPAQDGNQAEARRRPRAGFSNVKVPPETMLQPFTNATYKHLVRDKNLSDRAYRLWHLLHDHDGEKGCFPSIATLAKELGTDVGRVMRFRNELVEAGYLVVAVGGNRRKSRYWLRGGLRETPGNVGSGANAALAPAPMEGNPPNQTKQRDTRDGGSGEPLAATSPESNQTKTVANADATNRNGKAVSSKPSASVPSAASKPSGSGCCPPAKRPTVVQALQFALTHRTVFPDEERGFDPIKVKRWLDELDLNRTGRKILEGIDNEHLSEAMKSAFEWLHYNNRYGWPLEFSWLNALERWLSNWQETLVNRGSGWDEPPCGWVPHVCGVDGWPENEEEAPRVEEDSDCPF